MSRDKPQVDPRLALDEGRIGGIARSRSREVPPRWAGCYIGGYVGGAWSDRDATFSD
jgi:hypothetical protein